jgi:hypothetical protein
VFAGALSLRASTCTVLGLTLHAALAQASSVAATTLPFRTAVARSARIVEGKVTDATPFAFQGKPFWRLEIAVEKTIKGAPGRPGEVIHIFNPGQWFQFTHAAAIRGGVISYEDPRYHTPVQPRELKKGTVLIFFLQAEPPPAEFPAHSAFLMCAEAYDRADREKEITALNPRNFDEPIQLKVSGHALLPDGLQIELRGHAHKRPMVGGPSKEMSELQLTAGPRSELISLGHVVGGQSDGKVPKEEWETHEWERYRLELLKMNYDVDTTLRVHRTR